MTKALVIVAHPDDETIWMGGYIIRYPDWDWTIVALCRVNDGDREPRFRNVCNILGAESYIFDLDDTEEGHFKKISLKDIEDRLMQIKEKRFDHIFTHGSNGEYGHIRHKQVSQAVTNMVEESKLKCKNLHYFSYHNKDEFCYANQNAEKYIKLSDKELEEKKNLIRNVYGFEAGSFEEVCASGAEAFNIMKVK